MYVSNAHAQTYNVLKTAYYTDTAIGQAIPFTTAMKSGGTLVFNVSAMDGGGRTGENDKAFLRITFFDSSGGMVNQQQSSIFTLNKVTFTILSLSTIDCGGSCANVAYAVIEMVGTDASFWAGNYGVQWKLPDVSFTGTSGNLVYNPEFGVAPGTLIVQGWAQSSQWGDPGFGVCTGAGGGANSCISDTTIVANSSNGGYVASGGTIPAPQQPAYPSYVTVGSGTPPVMEFGSNSDITGTQQTKIDLWSNRTIPDGNQIHIEQKSGEGNTVTMDQDGNKNLIRSKIDGSRNSMTVKQGTQGIGQNEIKIDTVGDDNQLVVNQARTTQGTAIGGNGHYQAVDINGSNNILSTQQINTGGVGGHFMETTINGNQNNITARQTDNGNKIMFTNIQGNNNTVEAVQKGTGQHYLDTKLTGNNNSVSALQEGGISNKATLDLTNAGGPASVILQQNGGQNVTVTTTCATAGGCAPVTIRQGY